MIRSLTQIAFLSTLLSTLLSPVASQIPPGHAVVASHLPGSPATVLLAIELATGTTSSIGRFSSDHLAPLAVLVDGIDRDVVVALDASGHTRIVRLALNRLSVASERRLADVPGPVTDMILARAGTIVVAVGGPNGALYDFPRNGGLARRLASYPFASAMFGWGLLGSQSWLLQSGTPPAVDGRISIVDFATGQSAFQTVLTGAPRDLTGIVDVPTALPRALVSAADGTLWMASPHAPLTQIGLSPQPRDCPIVALGAGGRGVLALGSRTHPFLITFPLFTNPAPWQVVAGPLPGAPIDFDVPVDLAVVWFGASCPDPGAPSLGHQAGFGAPQVGNAQFRLLLSSRSRNAPVLFLLGLDDEMAFGGLLPQPLPFGGCPLYVSNDISVGATTDPLGRAELRVPIPNQPALVGFRLFAQGFEAQGAILASSNPIAVHIQR